MSNVAVLANYRDAKERAGWCHGVAMCRACQWAWIALWPGPPDTTTLECPKCHSREGVVNGDVLRLVVYRPDASGIETVE